MNAPCKYCEKRGCGAYHDTCPEYQKFVQSRLDIEAKQQEQGMMDKFVVESGVRHINSRMTKKSPLRRNGRIR